MREEEVGIRGSRAGASCSVIKHRFTTMLVLLDVWLSCIRYVQGDGRPALQREGEQSPRSPLVLANPTTPKARMLQDVDFWSLEHDT